MSLNQVDGKHPAQEDMEPDDIGRVLHHTDFGHRLFNLYTLDRVRDRDRKFSERLHIVRAMIAAMLKAEQERRDD